MRSRSGTFFILAMCLALSACSASGPSFVPLPDAAPDDTAVDAGDDASLDVGFDVPPTMDVSTDRDARDVAVDARDVTLDVAPDAVDVTDALDVADAPRHDASHTCVTSADCDDGVTCTNDDCVMGLCSSVPDLTLCAENQNCDVRVGCVTGASCSSDADCRDPDPCHSGIFCDPDLNVCLYDARDDDFDGFTAATCGGADCNDSSASVHPGAAERCNGVDDNCDGRVDEAGASPLCAGGGTCTSGSCVCMTSGSMLCGARCVDVASDSANCGACGHACDTGAPCAAGVCGCATSRMSCGGRCVDTTSDAANCGACGHACTAPTGSTPACARGVCGIACAAGRGDCDGNPMNGCETDTRADRLNCGACGHACAVGAACTLGSCPGEDWARSVGGTSDDRGWGVTTAPSGDVILAGSFGASVAFGSASVATAGSSDAYVAAFDAGGAPRWIRRMGGGDYDEAAGVATDAMGNVYVVGSVQGSADLGGGATTTGTESSIFVSSFTSAGEFRWAHRFGDSFLTAGRNAGTDAAGNVYVMGSFENRVDFGGGMLDAGVGISGVIVSLSGSGVFRWALQLNATDLAEVESVAFNDAGDGVFVATFDESITVGGTTYRSVGDYDVLAVGVTSAGAVRWIRNYGGADEDDASGVAIDPTGNVYLAGTFASASLAFGGDALANAGARLGTQDIYVASLSATGDARWSRRFGGTDDDAGTAIAVDSLRNVHVAGAFHGAADFGGTALTSAGSSDALLLTLTSDGTMRRARAFGGSLTDNALWVGAAGPNALIAGSFGASMPIAGGTLTSLGAGDAFVARLAP